MYDWQVTALVYFGLGKPFVQHTVIKRVNQSHHNGIMSSIMIQILLSQTNQEVIKSHYIFNPQTLLLLNRQLKLRKAWA